MTRLIDSSLEKLSTIMSDMGEMAIQCISLATDSFVSALIRICKGLLTAIKCTISQIRYAKNISR